MESAINSNVEDYSADIVIIGGGGGGLPAAVSAVEAGVKKVIVLERNRILGGMGRMPGAIFAVESPAQKRQDIHHTADEIFKIHMEYANWMCDARLVRTWLNGCGDIIRWLEGKGLKFDVEAGNIRVSHKLRGQRLKTGNAIMNACIKDCEEAGVKTFTETRARKLLTDKDGNVTGVLATRNGVELRFAAKSVIIATGPISGNKELIKRYYPHINFENIKIMSAFPQNMGDGLLMSEEVGAAEDGLVTPLWVGPGNHLMNMSATNVVRRPHMMWVNKYGMRFIDETIWTLHPYHFSWQCGFALNLQPDKTCYALMDEKILQDMIKKKENVLEMESQASRMVDDKAELAAGMNRETGPELRKSSETAWLGKLEDALQSEIKLERIKKSDSWDEIAVWMGADPAVLRATVEQYNAFCRNGHDADFLKPKEWLLPLSTPPYYAMTAGQLMDAAFGGIRISHRMEVLDKELRPIGGLYAAGAATSGWLGTGFTFGCAALGFSVFSGYAAGKNAAENIRSKT